MMTEIWWKVFIAAILTVIAAKIFGCPLGIFLLFSVSFIGWAVGLILLMVVGEWACDFWKKRKS